jgi:hypothetical protein
MIAVTAGMARRVDFYGTIPAISIPLRKWTFRRE